MRRRDHVLHVADGQAVAAERDPVGHDVEIVAPDHALGVGAGGAGHRLDHGLDLAGGLFHLGEVGAEHLDADRRADAGREHVDAGPDRHRPGVRDAGNWRAWSISAFRLASVTPGRHSLLGFVALTWKGQNEPSRMGHSGRPKSWFTRRISPVTPGCARTQWPRRIMRMTSKPFRVAEAVFILWKPRVGRITRLSAP